MANQTFAVLANLMQSQAIAQALSQSVAAQNAAPRIENRIAQDAARIAEMLLPLLRNITADIEGRRAAGSTHEAEALSQQFLAIKFTLALEGVIQPKALLDDPDVLRLLDRLLKMREARAQREAMGSYGEIDPRKMFVWPDHDPSIQSPSIKVRELTQMQQQKIEPPKHQRPEPFPAYRRFDKHGGRW